MANVITNMITAVNAASTAVGMVAMAGIKSEISGFSEIGRQMMEGIRRGIETGRSGVIKAAERIAKLAARAAKDILQIKSPSKVFEEMGRQTWEGFIKGMDEELDAKQKRAKWKARLAVQKSKGSLLKYA